MSIGLYAHKGRKEEQSGIFLSPSPQPLFVWLVWFVELVGWLDGDVHCMLGELDGNMV